MFKKKLQTFKGVWYSDIKISSQPLSENKRCCDMADDRVIATLARYLRKLEVTGNVVADNIRQSPSCLFAH
jgi:hypothetical protein